MGMPVDTGRYDSISMAISIGARATWQEKGVGSRKGSPQAGTCWWWATELDRDGPGEPFNARRRDLARRAETDSLPLPGRFGPIPAATTKFRARKFLVVGENPQISARHLQPPPKTFSRYPQLARFLRLFPVVYENLQSIMSAIGSLVFCTDCGNLLDGSSGDKKAMLVCDVCGASCRGMVSLLLLALASHPRCFFRVCLHAAHLGSSPCLALSLPLLHPAHRWNLCAPDCRMRSPCLQIPRRRPS